MKILFLTASLLMLSCGLRAQESPDRPAQSWPVTVTIFSESISLPNFRSIFRNGNLGIRVGTEIYYRQRSGHQLLQTVNLGYYAHRNFHNALYISSEFGYRKFFGQTFVDATIGAGYLIADSALPRYERVCDTYQKATSVHGKLIPTLGLGAGYQFEQLALFGRYELFGEMPFGFKGVPALPHKAVHLGTRFNF